MNTSTSQCPTVISSTISTINWVKNAEKLAVGRKKVMLFEMEYELGEQACKGNCGHAELQVISQQRALVLAALEEYFK